MSLISIIGYHTCKLDGGWSYVKNEAPFLSGKGDNQWLSQGFYFWTDSDYFAHDWGKKSYSNAYAIVRCKVDVEETALLDCVGSVDAQMFLKKHLTKFQQHLDRLNKQPSTVTVSALIRMLRQKNKDCPGFFPFVAIKAQDFYHGDSVRFVENRCETMPLLTRQQLCLFEDGAGCIVEKEVIYPPSFVEQC